MENLLTGQHRPLWVVLMGNGCAEEGQDGIAHHVGEGAFVVVDRCYKVLEGSVHDPCPFLGIKLFKPPRWSP